MQRCTVSKWWHLCEQIQWLPLPMSRWLYWKELRDRLEQYLLCLRTICFVLAHVSHGSIPVVLLSKAENIFWCVFSFSLIFDYSLSSFFSVVQKRCCVHYLPIVIMQWLITSPLQVCTQLQNLRYFVLAKNRKNRKNRKVDAGFFVFTYNFLQFLAL